MAHLDVIGEITKILKGTEDVLAGSNLPLEQAAHVCYNKYVEFSASFCYWRAMYHIRLEQQREELTEVAT
jgi:hypothetical protein